MWTPHEFTALRFAPPLHAGSTPVRMYSNVWFVPSVVIGPIVPITASVPL
jgi:hypothetical protein